MALVTKIAKVRKDKVRVHGSTECELSIFAVDDRPYLQLDTFGSRHRRDRGQVSQVIQLDKAAMKQLRAFIDEALADHK